MRKILISMFVLGLLALTAVSQTATAQVTPPSFETLAETLLPTVVNVSTTTKIKQPPGAEQLPPLPQFPPGSPFEHFFKDFYDKYKNNQPPGMGGDDRQVSALGSGFIIDAKQGYIVTNNHVIKDADEIKIILHDDTTLDATLVGVDEKTDLAVIKVKPTGNMVAANWGDSDTAKVGSWVLAIGNPFGLGGTVTAGIVSARQRNINAGPYDDFIQTDASINRGNSGGPMFNTQGQVVGINTAIFSPSGGSVGIGFSVPSNIAKSVVAQLVKYGKTKRGWIGVRIQEVTPEIAETLGLDRARGALVSGVTEKGPAEKAGIKAGDVIISFNGQDVSSMRRLPRLVAESEVGAKTTVTLWRKDGEKTVTVELGQLETAEAAQDKDKKSDEALQTEPAVISTDIPALGLGLSALDDAARDKYGLPAATTGVLVTQVTKGGPAAEKGLTEGDVVVEVDQSEVKTPADVKKKIDEAVASKRSSALLFIARKDGQQFVAVKLKK
jgi:serine protease Do